MTALNPAYLKLELALDGIALDASVRSRPEVCGHRPPLGGDTGHTIELLLPDDVVVDAPITSGDSRPDTLPYRLVCDGEQWAVERRGERVDVRVIPPPQFYARTTAHGTPMGEVGTVFGSFIALRPLGSCGFSWRQGPCRVCTGDGQAAASDPPPRRHRSEVVETVHAAFDEGTIEFVCFNGGPSEAEDGGIAAIEPYIRAVKRQFDTFVAVQVHPPASNAWIDRTYAMGVDAVNYSTDIHDAALLARVCPGRVARIGRERYYEALAYAATVFPSGTVWSDLLVGLEPAESTQRGIDVLSQAGVLPVLSLSPPGNGAAPGTEQRPRAEEIAPVVAHLFHAVRRAKINMGWVRDLSYAVTPLEARFFASDDARLSVTQQFYRSRLGGMTARNLARLRRRLRVRTVSDSFDSSHL